MKAFCIILLMMMITGCTTLSLQAQSNIGMPDRPAEAAGSQKIKFKEPELRNKLGFAASMISGYGLSYAYRIDNLYEIEFTGSVFGEGGKYDNGNDKRSYIVATLGGEFQRNFYIGQDSRFYGLIGGSYWLDRTKDYYVNLPDTYSNEDAITVGLAIGLEFNIVSHLLINCEGGYLYRNSTKYGSGYPTATSYSLGFGIGGGIYYAF